MVRSAYLRVYIPDDQVTVALAALPVVEPALAELRSNAFGLVDEALEEVAFEAEHDGVRYLCPRRARLRMLEGVLAFHNGYAGVGGEVLVPEAVADLAADELSKLRDAQPEQMSHILTSPWHVPLRWFVAFSPDDREVIESGSIDNDSGVSIRYRTSRQQASDRLEEALSILRDVDMDDGVIANVEEFEEWVNKFDPATLVELDYGSVAGLFSGQDLVFDESANEVWESIRSLQSGDLDRSAQNYNDVVGRWSRAMAVTYMN